MHEKHLRSILATGIGAAVPSRKIIRDDCEPGRLITITLKNILVATDFSEAPDAALM
jgi:hypothetical protein